MNVLKAGIVSVVSIGGTAGTVILVRNVNLTSNKNESKKIKSVADKLKEENFTLISSKSEWQAMLIKYNGKKGEKGARFVSGDSVATEEELESACNSALGEDSFTSQNYFKSRRWCTVVKTLANHLSANNLTLLNINDSSEIDKEHWMKLQTSYEKHENNSISGLNFSNSDKWKNLKVKCKEISEKETIEGDFDVLFNNLKSWCTKEEADKLSQQ